MRPATARAFADDEAPTPEIDATDTTDERGEAPEPAPVDYGFEGYSLEFNGKVALLPPQTAAGR